MNPSLDSLRCFVEAARFLNFRAAAMEVALTPAALGQRIKQLEEQLGVQLFERTTRTVKITEKGVELLPYARKAVEAVENCVLAAHGETREVPLEVTIGTRYELGSSWLCELLPKLRVLHPELTIHLYFGSASELMLRVRCFEVDCAIVPQRRRDEKLDSIGLQEERFVCVASPEYLARFGSGGLTGGLNSEKHSVVDINEQLPLLSYLKKEAMGGSSNWKGRRLHMGTLDAVLKMVLLGEGFAVLPQLLVHKYIYSGKLTMILEKEQVSDDFLSLQFRKQDEKIKVYHYLADFLQSHSLRYL